MTVFIARARSARVYPLEALMADCRNYFAATGRRVTFEYTLMAGVNDSVQQVRASFAAAATQLLQMSPSSVAMTHNHRNLWKPRPDMMSRQARVDAAL